MRERCADVTLCTVGHGHIGDGEWRGVFVFIVCEWSVVCLLGNLHLNVVGEGHSTELLGLLEPFVFDWTGIHV